MLAISVCPTAIFFHPLKLRYVQVETGLGKSAKMLSDGPVHIFFKGHDPHENGRIIPYSQLNINRSQSFTIKKSIKSQSNFYILHIVGGE